MMGKKKSVPMKRGGGMMMEMKRGGKVMKGKKKKVMKKKGKKKQMPTYSSTANFDLSIDDIAEEAFERCGLQIRSGYDVKTARRSLNLLLAEWANRGLNLWTIQKQEKTLAANTTALTGINLFGSGADDSQQIVDITDVIIRDSSNMIIQHQV